MGRFNRVLQYYGIATTAIFFYEYFAMLPDEVSFRCSEPLSAAEPDPATVDSLRVVTEQNLGYVESFHEVANVWALTAG